MMNIKEIIGEIKTNIAKVGGLKHVYFVGCGGSQAAIFPGFYLLQSEAKTFSASIYTSNEFVNATPKQLDKQCICVICSLKATRETVEAVKVANKAGAVTIAMTGALTTGMAAVGQYVVVYSNGDDQIYSDSNQSNSLRIGFELLNQFEDYENYDAAMNAFQYVDQIIANGKEAITPTARQWAEEFKEEPIFYVLASGPNYGVAYSMSFCHFMEMQWKHAIAIHTGEYFHGPFETTNKELPIILLMSEGRTRVLDERCLAFLKKYAQKYIVVDPKKLGINEIDPNVVEFFNPVIMTPIERHIVSQMAEIRGHSMDMRRYMWKVEY
jgi:fructoselysine 6-phosphate deglycase